MVALNSTITVDKERAWEEKISTNIVGLPRYISVLNAF